MVIMAMELLDLLIVFIFVSVILLVVRRVLRGSQTHKAWSQLATQTNLNYDHVYDFFGKPFPGSINGTYRGRKVSLSYVTETERATRGDYTDQTERFIRAWIEIKSSSYGQLSLTEKFISRIVRPFKNRINDGWDYEFQRRFVIRSKPASFASKVFSSTDLRRTLVIGPTPSFVVSRAKTGLESRMSRKERRVDYWQSVLDNLCDVAEAIEDSLVSGYFGNPSDQTAA